MPTQDDQNNNQVSDTSSVPSFAPIDDLPPMPADTANSPQTTVSDPTVISSPVAETPISDSPFDAVIPTPDPVSSPPITDSGSAAPPDDIPPVTSAPKKKFGTGKIVATILGLFLLVGGVVAGVTLTGQKQVINEKAASAAACTPDQWFCQCNAGSGCLRSDRTEDYCINTYCGGSSNYVAGSYARGTSGAGSGGVNGTPSTPNNCSDYTQAEKQPNACWVTTKIGFARDNVTPCEGPHWTTCAQGYTCSNQDCVPIPKSTPKDTPNPTSTSTPTPGITAVCQNIKAYSATWALLTSAQLSALNVGDVVNFCVAGSTTGGSFDKAKFTINGTTLANTTLTHAGIDGFCQNYTIPTGVTTFNITAKIHHITLDWK